MHQPQSSKPKILYITARADVGGGQEILFRLLAQMNGQVDCFVACPHEEPYWTRYCRLLGEERVHAIPHRELSIEAIWRLKRLVEETSIELIHSHGFGAGLYGRPVAALCRVPLVHTFHGLVFHPGKPLWTSLRLAAEYILGVFSAALITVSDSEKLHLSRWIYPHRHKLTRIHNGLPALGELGSRPVEPTPPRILWIGRMHEQKNPELLIEVVKHLALLRPELDFAVDVVGDGPLTIRVRDLITASHLSEIIQFHGRKIDPTPYYRTANVLLSTSRWEGLPTCVLEAMQHETLVVATRAQGNTDLVEHGRTGFLFDSHSPKRAAELIARALADNQENREIRAAAFKMVSEQFSASAFRDEHIHLYGRILGCAPNRYSSEDLHAPIQVPDPESSSSAQ